MMINHEILGVTEQTAKNPTNLGSHSLFVGAWKSEPETQKDFDTAWDG